MNKIKSLFTATLMGCVLFSAAADAQISQLVKNAGSEGAEVLPYVLWGIMVIAVVAGTWLFFAWGSAKKAGEQTKGYVFALIMCVMCIIGPMIMLAAGQSIAGKEVRMDSSGDSHGWN